MDMDRLDVIRIWYGEINNIKRVILGIMHKDAELLSNPQSLPYAVLWVVFWILFIKIFV